MRPTGSLLATITLLVTACTPSPPPITADPHPPTPPLPPATDETYTVEGTTIVAKDEPDAARTHASSLLPCPRDQIKARWLHLGHRPHTMWAVLVEGCAQRVVYANIDWEDLATTAEPRNSLVMVSRFSLAPTPR